MVLKIKYMPVVSFYVAFWCGVMLVDLLLLFIILWILRLAFKILKKIEEHKPFYEELIFLFLSLYSLSSYFLGLIGIVYFDTSFDVLHLIIRNNLIVISVVYFIIELTHDFRARYIVSFANIRNKLLSQVTNVSKIKITLAALFLIILVLITILQIFKIGVANFFSNIRGHGTTVFIVGNFYLQILTIPISYILFSRGLHCKKPIYSKFILGLVVVFWIMYIFCGARKEVFIFAMIVVMSGLFDLKKNLKYFIGVLLIIFMLPMVREGYWVPTNYLLSLHEFVLPQYTQVIAKELMSSTQIEAIVEQSGLISGIGAMVPSFLRLMPYKPIGESILDLPYISVGLSVHPFAEFYINFGEYWWVAFVLFFVVGYHLIFILSRIVPELSVISFGYLAVYGRSDVWLTIFFIIYSTIVLVFFSRQIRIGNKVVI